MRKFGVITKMVKDTIDQAVNQQWEPISNEDQHILHTLDVSEFQRVNIYVNLTICKLNIESYDGSHIQFDQHGNHQNLLANMEHEATDSKVVVSFKSRAPKPLAKGNLKSEAILRLPKGVSYQLHFDLDIGQTKMVLDGCDLTRLSGKVAVGNVDLTSYQVQKQLESISINCEVGSCHLTLGDSPALSNLMLSANVGSVVVDLTERPDLPLSLVASAEVGDIKLKVPQNQEVIIDAKLTKFTSNMLIPKRAYQKNGDQYVLKGQDEQNALHVSAKVSIGSVQVN